MMLRLAGRSIPADPGLAVRVLRAEVVGLPRPLRLWLGGLAAILLVAAVAAVRALFPGDKALNTTPTFEWGLLIVGYVFFAITTSGLCLASSLGTVFGIERFRPLEKRHAILAVLSLCTAFGIIALDLHYPVRMVFGAVFNPSPSSPMWWMGVFYGIYLGCLLTEVWSMFFGHPTIHQAACVASSVMAVIAPSTLGAVFGVIAARPFWSGPFTPLLMVSSAFVSGTALLGIVFYAVCRFELAGAERARRLAVPAIRSLLLVGLGLVSLLVLRQAAAGWLSTDPLLVASTRALLVGPLALPYWTLRIVGGLVLPAVILVVPWGRTPAGVLAAAVLAMAGVFTDRLTFVMAGQIAPAGAVAGTVSAPWAWYVPSPVEVAILLGAFALVAFVYTLAERYLDLREADAHVGMSLHLPGLARVRALVSLARRGRVASEPLDVAAAPGPTPAVMVTVPAAAEPVVATEAVVAAEPVVFGDPIPVPPAIVAAEPVVVASAPVRPEP